MRYNADNPGPDDSFAPELKWEPQPEPKPVKVEPSSMDNSIGHAVATVVAVAVSAFILGFFAILGIGILIALWGVFFG